MLDILFDKMKYIGRDKWIHKEVLIFISSGLFYFIISFGWNLNSIHKNQEGMGIVLIISLFTFAVCLSDFL